MRKTMWPHMFRPQFWYMTLALVVLFFLIRNIYKIEHLGYSTVSAANQLHSLDHQTFTVDGGDPAKLMYCGYQHQFLTAQEEAEEKALLNTLKWPLFSQDVSDFFRSTDPSKSVFVIMRSETKFIIGSQLEILVRMSDFEGRPKKYGGDYLQARIYSPLTETGAVGKVVDHQNGIYTVIFTILWEGIVKVSVLLVHPSEGIKVLKRLRDEKPDRVFFRSKFRSGTFTESTECNLCLPGGHPVCNYTDRNTGEPWFCYKPKKLPCDTRVSHSKGGYQKGLLTEEEPLFFQSGINIKVPILSSGPDYVMVEPSGSKVRAKNTETTASDKATWFPSGFYFNDTWVSMRYSIQRFNNPEDVTACLQGKVVHFFGDSTIRQWFNYLTAFLPDLGEFDLGSPINVGPYMSVDTKNNIMLKFRCHGPPIRFSSVSSSELRYIANELDGIEGGLNTVVAISIWSHFSTFPVEVYIRRLRNIRKSVLRMLNRSPDTVIVIKTANVQELGPEISLFNSDWFSFQLDMVMRKMFEDVNVFWVDAWEMTLAHHLPHNLHPQPVIIKNQIDVFLSHVCLRNVRDV
ncbi:NXPE family member 3 isoform X2 [Protopterus annectens]|uniref:NXPE family member 3 isoform X2 n=1 Tax=Protopterus annectens TaxID=7888 RepID=UPI001CF93E8E|nr:NXPE family member 3 isoform X2 [Protopterus annectens]